jgi:ABC-type Fe3+-hydroxamate transport system, periplasmic component
MKKRIFGVLVILVLAAASFVSGKGEDNSFVDESGSRITVKKPFRRIISLYGAHTENLFSLGLDREIIGVSENEAYPPQAMTMPVFSYHDDAEKFIAARPDLVLIRPMIAQGYKNLIAKLEKAGITVVSLQPTTVDEMYSYWKKLGMLTGKEKKAEKMIEKFRTGLLEINSIVKTIPPSEQKRVYFEAIHSRMKTFSPSSIAIFALKTAGGVNIADDAKAVRGTNIAAYGKERILSRADEIDVYLAQKGTMNRSTVKTIAEEAGFKAIKAVRNREIYIIDEKIVSRPTLRLLDGIQEIGRILYPDRFTTKIESRSRKPEFRICCFYSGS